MAEAIPLLVTARLASPLAGEPPALEALLEWAMSLHHPKAEPGYKVDRRFACPPPGAIPIPVRRRDVGGWPVALCSAAIIPAADSDGHEHIAKRIDVAHAGLLAGPERRVVATTNSWTKSYRLPLRVRRVACVRWFAVGVRREVLATLRRHVHAVGKKVADGYGRVAGWEVEAAPADYSWFAPTDRGPLLMRPLPAGPWLPAGLVGARADFGACVPPLWHPERHCDIVVPS